MQSSEKIKIGEKEYRFDPDVYPLTNYLKDKEYKFDDPQGADDYTVWTDILPIRGNRGIRSIFGSPDCRRGYIGTWEIINKELYLIDFESIIIIKDQDDNIIGKKVDLSYLFPDATSVKADWFTGCIKIETGEVIGRKGWFNFPIYSDLIEIEIEQGNVLKTTNKKYQKPVRCINAVRKRKRIK